MVGVVRPVVATPLGRRASRYAGWGWVPSLKQAPGETMQTLVRQRAGGASAGVRAASNAGSKARSEESAGA
jgi:hypothetical protein